MHDKLQRDQLIARLKAAGIPTAVESRTEALPQLKIQQNFGAYDSTIFKLNAGTSLIVPLKVVVNARSFKFSDVGISLSCWPSALFSLLVENTSDEWPAFEFKGRSELKFARSEVINHYIAEQKGIRRGDCVRGLLLAYSPLPMPDELDLGDILYGFITLYDQLDREHSAKISLRVNRPAAQLFASNRMAKSNGKNRL